MMDRGPVDVKGLAQFDEPSSDVPPPD